MRDAVTVWSAHWEGMHDSSRGVNRTRSLKPWRQWHCDRLWQTITKPTKVPIWIALPFFVLETHGPFQRNHADRFHMWITWNNKKVVGKHGETWAQRPTDWPVTLSVLATHFGVLNVVTQPNDSKNLAGSNSCGIHVFEIHFRGARGYPMSSLSALQEREETDSQRAIGIQCNSTEALCPWWTCTCWLHPVIAVSSQPILGLCRASKLRSFCFESRSANYRPTKGRDTRSEHWPYGVREVMCGGPIWNPVERCRKSHWSNGLNDISRNSR